MIDESGIDLDAMYDAGLRWMSSVEGQLYLSGKVTCTVCCKDFPILHSCDICRMPACFGCMIDDECLDCLEDRLRIAQKIIHTINRRGHAVSTTWYADPCMQVYDDDGSDAWLIWSYWHDSGDPAYIGTMPTYEQARRVVDAHNQRQGVMSVF